MRTLAVLSLHTSPLAQPGVGDGGGMNVYVRELGTALAQAGVDSTVFVRRWSEGLPDVVELEPGFRVVHIDAGPVGLPKEDLVGTIEEFSDGVESYLRGTDGADALHANYWLSGLAGHTLKHRLQLPLISTFHTLARVKAEAGDHDPEGREAAEASIMGCSDVILASCEAEVDQLIEHYHVDRSRIELVAPGVDHAFFSPGDRDGARKALGLDDRPTVLFVGRIQPLKGLDVAIEALDHLTDRSVRFLAVGGASGIEGDAEFDRVQKLIAERGLADRVTLVAPQPHHLLSTWYRAADVCLVPSRSESFGLVALEAAACGVPVVASAVGGLLSLVDHGRTGYLVESRLPADFARRIDELLADPVLAEQFGQAGAQRAQEYRWSVAAGRLRRIYADLSRRAPVFC